MITATVAWKRSTSASASDHSRPIPSTITPATTAIGPRQAANQGICAVMHTMKHPQLRM